MYSFCRHRCRDLDGCCRTYPVLSGILPEAEGEVEPLQGPEHDEHRVVLLDVTEAQGLERFERHQRLPVRYVGQQRGEKSKQWRKRHFTWAVE